MKTKFIVIKLEEQNGEFSYRHLLTREVTAETEMTSFAKDITKTFYSGKAVVLEEDEDFIKVEFLNGEIAVGLRHVAEITKKEYQTLNKYLDY